MLNACPRRLRCVSTKLPYLLFVFSSFRDFYCFLFFFFRQIRFSVSGINLRPLANIDEFAGHRGGGGHLRADQVRAAALALAAFEIPV